MHMAQNINMQYVLMPNAGVLATGETDQLCPTSLQVAISMHHSNPGGRVDCANRLNLGFRKMQAQNKMYTEWRNCANDQMIVRGCAPGGRMGRNCPDADFAPICTGLRTLRHACDLIVYAVAANDMKRPNAPQAHVPGGGKLGETAQGTHGPNVPAAPVNVPGAGQRQ